MTYCAHKVTEGYCLDCLRASRDAALARVGVLEREVEMLRRYGNKDCTAMADAALSSPPPHDGEGAP